MDLLFSIVSIFRILMTRDPLVCLPCHTCRYEVLGIHEFDSVRKRMSVIVECPDKTIKLLVKGADSSVLNIITEIEEGNLRRGSEVTGEAQRGAEILSATLEHLDRYAREGLRTLVVASKDLSQKEVNLITSSEVVIVFHRVVAIDYACNDIEEVIMVDNLTPRVPGILVMAF
jgi:magnesium-transporting ATPase (P-type)